MTQWPTRWKELTLAVLDVETTGLDPQEDRIIEVGIIRFENGEVIERYGQLIDPRCPLPPETTQITGIKQEDVDGMPTFAEVSADIHQRLEGVGIVAYNLSFDKSFLVAELGRCGLDWPDAPELDPLIFARQFFRNSPRKNLGAISKLLGIPLEEAHRAVHDAEVAGKVLYAFEDRLPESLQELLTLQSQWEVLQAQEMSNWRGFESTLTGVEQTVGLGPAYIYGDEADPLRALYMSVPDAPAREP